MTTAAANSTTTGTLPANTLLRVLGDSIVTITRNGAFVAKQSTARDNFVGPYPVDSTYSVVAGGSAVDIKVTGEGGGKALVPAMLSTDANGNTVLVGADGTALTAVILSPASGDTTGDTDTAAIFAAITTAMAGNKEIHIPMGAYIVNKPITFQDGLHITIAAGTTIKMADSFTMSCGCTNGSPTVTVADTSRLKVGMKVLDTAANLQAGDAFGATPSNADINVIGSGQITLSGNCSATGTRTLRFYYNTNIILADGVSDWSLVCKDGWAVLDGNGQSHQYPYAIASQDAWGNCVRLINTEDYVIDGIQAQNARFHGLIAVGKQNGHNIKSWRGVSNGFRSIHFHGETISPYTDPEVKGHFGALESDSNGWLAFKTQGGDDLNSGVFVVFDNAAGQTIESVRSINDRGIGFLLYGRNSGSPLTQSRCDQVGMVYTENAACGIGMFGELEQASVGTATINGKYRRITGCATLATASADWYYVPSATGIAAAFKIKAVQLPVGSIAAYGIREGMRIFMSGGSTGMSLGGTVIAKVGVGAGAGGTDWIWVFNDAAPTGDPYTTAASGIDVNLWACRHSGVYLYNDAGKTSKGLKFGTLNMRYPGKSGFVSEYSATEYRYYDVSIGSLSVYGTAQNALYGNSINGMTIGHLHHENCGTGFQETAIASGDGINLLRNCGNVTIYGYQSRHTAAFTNNLEDLRTNSLCRNINVHFNGVRKPSGAATLVAQNTVITAPWTGAVTGPIVYHNPVDNVGAALTVVGGHITRTDATTAIVTRPVDAP